MSEFFGLYFPVIRLNTEIDSKNLLIQSEFEKTHTSKNAKTK